MIHWNNLDWYTYTARRSKSFKTIADMRILLTSNSFLVIVRTTLLTRQAVDLALHLILGVCSRPHSIVVLSSN